MIDNSGKLAGKINVIDLSFIMIVSIMLFGLVWVALGNSPLHKEILSTGRAEVTVAIRGARALDTSIFKVGEKAFLTIRNSRYDDVDIVKINIQRRHNSYMSPQGKVISIPDPAQPEVYDVDLTFADNAEVLKDGVTMGGYKLKVGNTVELDAFGYRFRGSIMKVDMKGQ